MKINSLNVFSKNFVYENQMALQLLPHKLFTFVTIYLFFNSYHLFFYSVFDFLYISIFFFNFYLYKNQMALQLVPHKLFTFAELWLLFAKFLIRRKDLAGARKTLGQAIGEFLDF